MAKLAHLNNRYELIQEISAKGQQIARKVFLGWDSHTQEHVVIKVVQPGSNGRIDIEIFQQEAQILSKLNHPAIPSYKDTLALTIEGNQSFVLVQPYIEAFSLETLIQSGKRFSVVEIKELAERLLTILSYLHGRTSRVIHRNIKPSNVLLDQPGGSKGATFQKIYLIDFGLSEFTVVHQSRAKAVATTTIIDSYDYMPIEQVWDHARPASDLYSLGMTLIYLTTYTHPADLSHVDGKVQLPQHTLDPFLVQWLQQMTDLYLSKRFKSARQALRSLRSHQINQSNPHT